MLQAILPKYSPKVPFRLQKAKYRQIIARFRLFSECISYSAEQLVTLVVHLDGIGYIVVIDEFSVAITHERIEITFAGTILVGQVKIEFVETVSHTKGEPVGGLPVGEIGGRGIVCAVRPDGAVLESKTSS